MTRPIKFRAWVGRERMEYFPDLNEEGNTFCMAYPELDKERGGAVLMQFTGLLDKNGKEIYEGDLLKYYEKGYPITEVFFVAPDFLLRAKNHTLRSFLRNGKQTDYKIIGNIYENKYLLK